MGRLSRERRYRGRAVSLRHRDRGSFCPVREGAHGDAVGRRGPVRRNGGGAASEEGGGAALIAAFGVCEADRELGEASPELPLVRNGRLPRVLENLVRGERKAGVEEVLRL